MRATYKRVKIIIESIPECIVCIYFIICDFFIYCVSDELTLCVYFISFIIILISFSRLKTLGDAQYMITIMYQLTWRWKAIATPLTSRGR